LVGEGENGRLTGLFIRIPTGGHLKKEKEHLLQLPIKFEKNFLKKFFSVK